MFSDTIYTPLIDPKDGRIGVSQRPGSTGPKIPQEAISGGDQTFQNVSTHNITPTANNAYDIGTSAKKYSNIYAINANLTSATIPTLTSTNAAIENISAGTVETDLIQVGDLKINTTSSVVTGAAAQDSYVNVTINGVVYKLLLKA